MHLKSSQNYAIILLSGKENVINIPKNMVANFRLDENVLDLLQLQDLPESEKAEFLAKLTGIVQSRVVNVILERLSENQRDEFDALINAEALPEKIEVFLKKNVPDFDVILSEESLRLKNQIVEDADAMRQMITK